MDNDLTITPPGDKSITHRAILASLLLDDRWTGPIVIQNALDAGDIDASLRAASAFGVVVDRSNDTITMRPGDKPGTRKRLTIDCGRSGTTMRLVAGIAAASPYEVLLTGGEQLLRRPMERVAEALRPLGADIEIGPDGIRTRPAPVLGASVELQIASAQLKSAVLFCAAKKGVAASVHSPFSSRDHSERMLESLGFDVKTTGTACHIEPGLPSGTFHTTIPGDPSSSAFWVAAGLLRPAGSVRVAGVSLNPSRTGFLDVMRRMGGRIRVEARGSSAGEPYGDMIAEPSNLHAVRILADEVPGLIDELPLIALLASQATGQTEVHGAEELRAKECDRISATTQELRRLGADIHERSDGWDIKGPAALVGVQVTVHDDHRIAMMLHIASLVTAGNMTFPELSCIEDSYPTFLAEFSRLGAR